MSMLNLKYGNGIVTLNIRNAAKLEKLSLPSITPLADAGSEFVNAASYRCIGSLGLNYLVAPGDRITIVLRNNPHIHASQILYMLAYYFHSLNIPYADMAVLVACGTESADPQAFTPPELAGQLPVQVHQCDSAELVSVGSTSHGIAVTVHPLLRERKVVLIDGVQRDPLTGFSGGPECLLNVCGRATIESCYARAVEGNTLSSAIQSGVIVGNPLCEEMTEIARLISPMFAVYVITDAAGRLCRFVCGSWLDAWYESCNEVQQLFGVPISGGSDIVAASCGGYPKDATMLAACRSLFHAAQTVQDGGTIILAAECRDGGPDTFLGAQEPPNSPCGLAYLGFCSLVKRYRVLMQSKIHTQTLAALGVEGFRTMETLESKVDFNGKVVRSLPCADIAAPYRI